MNKQLRIHYVNICKEICQKLFKNYFKLTVLGNGIKKHQILFQLG